MHLLPVRIHDCFIREYLVSIHNAMAKERVMQSIVCMQVHPRDQGKRTKGKTLQET